MTRDTVDAVVIGSGFGGAVVACRVAEAGYDVLLLERGRRYPPGSFPRAPAAMARNMWDPSEGLHGMFDIWSFKHFEAIVASGLGGGSLIYANVMLRKDERWFVKDSGPSGGYESWPVTREDLDPCYDKAEEVLGVQGNPYPHMDQTPKTQAMRRAAERLKLDWFRPPLAVSFAGKGQQPGDPVNDDGENLHGAVRRTCSLCGECNVGCNTGSKNTLDYNYLSSAQRAGALLRDRCEVRTIEPVSGGYEVGYVVHEPENDGIRLDTTRLPITKVRARVVIVAAGALGSTYLLLRNRKNLPALGPALGARFSGNGDLLGFVKGSRDRLQPATGPVITSTVRVPDALDGGDGRGFYLQEGGYPAFIDYLVEATGVGGAAKRVARTVAARVRGRLRGALPSQIGAEVSGLMGTGQRCSGVLPLLGMGRDVPDGTLRLRRDQWLDVDWQEKMSRPYFDRLTSTMAAVAEELGGRLRMNPTRFLRRLITVHPLGGCPMAAEAGRGVVDSHGETFGHPGLFVADGSVMPGPVGANPSLTIAALAERFSAKVIERLATATAAPRATLEEATA